MNTVETVLEYFESRGVVPGESLEEKLQCAYLNSKLLDSFGIIEMVSHFEDTFAIHFESEDLLAAEFQTIGGVAALIDKLRAKIG